MRKVGDRVIAIAGMKDGVVRSFGEGTYQGRQIVPEGRGFLGMDIAGYVNHCIQLDSGEAVYGHECWWGDIEKMNEMIGEARIEVITIADYYRGQDAEEG